MNYIETCKLLKKIISSGCNAGEVDGVSLFEFAFNSLSHKILPGANGYLCENHKSKFNGEITDSAADLCEDPIHIKDFNVEENKSFKYYIFKTDKNLKASKVIFLFHGFNEKSWDKYLPWAKIIAEKTKSAVVLFPIAFHMNRAPLNWTDKRKMFVLSEERKKDYPNIINSSLSNVAISMRLHSMPKRFVWSGLQTYYDVISFIENCKSGGHSLIDKNFTIDIFSYSIGGLLAQILKLSNHKGYFDKSKVCIFCGGAVFNRLSPVSKFILDSEAAVALYSCLVEHINSHLKEDGRLNHYMREDHLEGRVFSAMLDYKTMRDYREELLKKAEKYFYAIALKKDSVAPSYEIINTLQGAARDINIPVDIFDFQYDYTHENPFPLVENNAKLIEDSFNATFARIVEFLDGRRTRV